MIVLLEKKLNRVLVPSTWHVFSRLSSLPLLVPFARSRPPLKQLRAHPSPLLFTSRTPFSAAAPLPRSRAHAHTKTLTPNSTQLVGRTVDEEATRRLEAEMDAAADNAGSPARAGGAGTGKGKPAEQSPLKANGQQKQQQQQRGGKGGEGGGASAAPIAEGAGAKGNGEVRYMYTEV